MISWYVQNLVKLRFINISCNCYVFYFSIANFLTYIQFQWRDTMKCPTEQEYCDMVIDKTGGKCLDIKKK